jgi:hypothetical protein
MINVRELPSAAIGDGMSHVLKERYATLTAAQAVYGFVTDIDKQTIDWAVIQAAVWSAPSGAMVLLPRGEYVLSDDLHVSRPTVLMGEGRGTTMVRFNAGKGLIVDDWTSSPNGGPPGGGGSTITNLDLSGARLPDIDYWQPGTCYNKGQKIWAPNDNRFYYECVKKGESLGAADPWKPKEEYATGKFVRTNAIGASPADPPPAEKNLFFQCISVIGDCLSGTVEPVWDLTTDCDTYDGEQAISHERNDGVRWRRIVVPPVDPPHPPASPPANLQGPWERNRKYAVGEVVEATDAFKAALFFISTKGGQSGIHEPAWGAAPPGEETADGVVRWGRYPFGPPAPEPYVEVPRWTPTTDYIRSSMVRPDPVDPVNPVVYVCTQLGTSGSIPPALWDHTPGSVTTDGTAQWICRRDPSFFPDGDTVWVCKVAPGIWLRTQANVYNVSVSGFTNAGIHVQSLTFPPTNANRWQINNAAIHKCGLGVLVAGSDSQAGTGVGLLLQGNGYTPSGTIDPRGNGGLGIYDRGNAANTWVGCQIQANTGRAFVSPTGNSQSILVGCYVENGEQPSYLGTPAVAIGTINANSPASQGWVINNGDAVEPFVVRNAKGIKEIQTYVGYDDNTMMVPFAWQTSGDPLWSLRWYNDERLWATEWANSSDFRANYLTGSNDHSRGAGLQGFNNFLLGPTSGSLDHPIKMSVALEKPAANHNATVPTGRKWDLYKKGDIVLNANPNSLDPSQQYIGWVCVDASNDNNQIWKGFGKIEP